MYLQLGIQKRNKNFVTSALYGTISSQYFFRRVKGIPGALRVMVNDVNTKLYTDEEILAHCVTFYDNLYGLANPPQLKLSNFSYIPKNIRLSNQDSTDLEEELLEEELFEALKKMRKGTSPGWDAFTVQFYEVFWDLIKDFVFNSACFAAKFSHFPKINEEVC